MMLVTFHYTLRLFVVNGCCIHHVPRPKMIIASLTRWGRKSKDVALPMRADEKFVIPNLSHHFVSTHTSHFWFWSGSEGFDAKSALRQFFVWISCGGWWILYRQLVPHHANLCLDFLWRLVNLYRQLVPHRAYLTLLCRMKSVKIHWNTWRCRS